MTWQTPLLNWKDKSGRNQIINQIIIEEYPKQNWLARAQERLQEYNIQLSRNTLSQHRKNLQSGKRKAVFPSIFSGQMNARMEKEIVYGKIETVEDLFIKDRVYVGLPANQLIGVSKRYKEVFACENNINTLGVMRGIKSNFGLNNVEIINNDIISFLFNSQLYFSRFDLDLMEHLTTNRVIDIAHAVSGSMMNMCVCNIISCSGRTITNEQYYELLDVFRNNISVDILHHLSGKYQDAQTPMRYEIFVLTRKK